MADQTLCSILKQGPKEWNAWREANKSIYNPDLTDIDLRDINLYGVNFQGANLSRAKFRGVDLREADFSGATLCGADTDLSFARLYDAKFNRANLTETVLFGADLRCAHLEDAILPNADLRDANLRDAKLIRAKLPGAKLDNAVLVKTDLTGADLSNCSVYGISAWEPILSQSIQNGLVISYVPKITVDDLEIAQFIYLLVNHKKIRNVINSVTQKGVLILGRFGNGGLDLLQSIAGKLRELSYLPIIFDFERPEGLDYTETVKTLVGLSRFVIVDLSGPSVPQELYATVPHFDVPVVPIIEKGRSIFAMFVDLLKYPWVLNQPFEFTSQNELIELIASKIIPSAEEMYKDRQAVLDRIFHR